MKKLLLITLLLLFLPTLLAIDLVIEKTNSQNIIIAGLDHPAIFNLKVTNLEGINDFKFYNLFGHLMEPKERITIERDETKNIDLIIYPREDMGMNFNTIEYYIEADSEEQIEKLIIKKINLEDAFEVGTGELDPDANSLNIYIHNKEAFNFENLNVRFSSKFFDFEEEFDLGPNERKDFDVELNKEDFKKIIAGFYTINAKITKNEVVGEVEGIIKFLEKGIVETEEKATGFIVTNTIVKKTNNGNTLSLEEITIEKNIISRLFTSFSPEPDMVERSSWKVIYTWTDKLNPGDSLNVIVTTNWAYPFLIIALIIVIVILVKKSTITDVVIRKKVSFVKAKGGQFALKVSLFISSKKYVERVNIIDRLPTLMKVYSKFGGVEPSRVDEKNKLIEWDFEKLEAGEIRTLSYVIYSKNIGVMGKFALPSAIAIFQKEGKVNEVVSNKAFFVTEQRKTDGSEFD